MRESISVANTTHSDKMTFSALDTSDTFVRIFAKHGKILMARNIDVDVYIRSISCPEPPLDCGIVSDLM